MKFLFRCHGMCTDCALSSEAGAAVLAVLPEARTAFRDYAADKADTYDFGSRFSDDSVVAQRIATAATEGEVLRDPLAWVLDALRDCASADHWYTFVKEY